MKIGSIDISYRMLIYAGSVAGLALALIAFWKGNADIRAESFYRDTIGRGLIADDDQGRIGGLVERGVKRAKVLSAKMSGNLYARRWFEAAEAYRWS